MNARRFRRLNRAYAYAAGFFWLPCPVCGQMFGGHELSDYSVPHPDPAKAADGYGMGTCWKHGRRL